MSDSKQEKERVHKERQKAAFALRELREEIARRFAKVDADSQRLWDKMMRSNENTEKK